MENKKNILLAILMWNHWHIGARCLKSVKKHTDFTNVKFMIIDNGSDDKQILEWLNSCDEDVLQLDKNYGIVGGMRVAFEEAFEDDDIEYVCFLNCDVLVTDGWLKRLVDVMGLDDRLIAVEPKDNNAYVHYQHFPIPEEFRPEDKAFGFFGNDGKLQKYINAEFYAKRKHPSFIHVENVDPPAALWRKSLVKEAGGFSDEFDYGLGVMELFMRAQIKGYKLAYCLSSFIYHHAHGGAGKYEGFFEMFGTHLNDFVAEKAGEIQKRYNIDLNSYGCHSINIKEALRKEEEIARL